MYKNVLLSHNYKSNVHTIDKYTPEYSFVQVLTMYIMQIVQIVDIFS